MQKKQADKRIAFILLLLSVLCVVAACLFIFPGLNSSNWSYNLPRRAQKVLAISITASAIAVSSLVFQTITGNRILTPSVMGLDSLYQFLQTVVVFVFGSGTISMVTAYGDFALTCALMILLTLVLYRLVFGRGGNMFQLVLVGMVFGTFFSSLSSFMQALIDPNEYAIVEGKMFASYNNINTSLLWVCTILIGACLAYVLATSGKLDVMALGRENAISLGLHYEREVLIYLVIVAALVAMSTALVGPITFLGILVVNLGRQMLKTYRHSLLGLGSSLLCIAAVVAGQWVVEQVFKFTTTVSVILNFAGGIYFLYLLIKERKA